MRIFPPYGTQSSGATVFGIEVFGMEKTVWYYKPIMFLYNILRRIDRIYYYLHYRFIKKFHILKLPLPYTWTDADERMFVACFVILGQFVEDELGIKAWFGSDTLYKGYRRHSDGGTDEQAIDLWLWYKNDLSALEKDYSDDIRACYSGKMVWKDAGNGLSELVDTGRTKEPKYEYGHVENVKDQKLKELIELRQSLWT